jgi:hypothetical protein
MTPMSSPATGVACRASVATRRSSLELDVAPTAVRSARHWTASLLAQANPPVDQDIVDSAVLLVSEMVTNAIRAVSEISDMQNSFPSGMLPIRALDKPRVWLSIIGASDLVRIEVHDSACVPVPVTARSDHADPEDESGRGLDVIAALATEWGWRPDPLGKVVWCELATG